MKIQLTLVRKTPEFQKLLTSFGISPAIIDNADSVQVELDEISKEAEELFMGDNPSRFDKINQLKKDE